MPTIGEFGGFVIRIHYRDEHGIPHFHVITPDEEAVYTINDGERIEGKVPAKIEKKALGYANDPKVKALMMEFWNKGQG